VTGRAQAGASVNTRQQNLEKASMHPAIVVNIYLNQDGTAASSSAPHAMVAQGASGTQPGIDIPPPPSVDPTEGSAAVEEIPAPPAAPSDQSVTRTPVPSVAGEPSGQDVPPPPSAGPTQASATNGGVPAPPAAPSDQSATQTPTPSVPSEWSGQDVPPPPVLDAEPSGGDEDIPPPPN